jgi:hypothetical protein
VKSTSPSRDLSYFPILSERSSRIANSKVRERVESEFNGSYPDYLIAMGKESAINKQ